MKRKLIAFISVFILLYSFLGLTSFAKYNDKAVYDRADLFTDAEKEALEAKAKEYFGKSYASVYIVTDRQSYGEVKYFGDHFRAEYGISGNSVILIITDNGNRNYDLYTYGHAKNKISDSEFNTIIDSPDVFNNIKSGKYANGAQAFIKISAAKCETNIKSVLLIALIPAFGAAILTFILVRASYLKKSRSEKYPLDKYAKLSLRLKRDDFMGSYVSKRYISSSSSGRSGGGGNSGGGGGGGHRGGR